MAKSYYDITLALSGICQSARLVQQLVHYGHCDLNAFRVSLNSIIDLNPKSTLEVFGGNEVNLRLGLEALLTMLNVTGSFDDLSTELTRYIFSLIALERKLNSAKRVINTLLYNRICSLRRQLEYFDLQSETLLGTMASIYVDVISPLGPRIKIMGSHTVLQNSQIQAKIRASLLSGIRAAVLWKQVGGGRLQLIFSRQHILTQAKMIITHC